MSPAALMPLATVTVVAEGSFNVAKIWTGMIGLL
jgi:hypothetical protein